VHESPSLTDRLRTAIVTGKYVSGQRLIESDLVEVFGASRFLLRNALIRLEEDGLVEMMPYRGARVREVQIGEAIDLLEIRQFVGSLVASRAAEKATPRQAARLAAHVEALEVAVANVDPVSCAVVECDLNSSLQSAARHPSAARILRQLDGQTAAVRRRLWSPHGRPGSSLREYQAIVRAVCDHDPAAAHAATSSHIAGLISALRAYEPISGVP
jgi:DNA-binding GntR family transcriptional regulator